MLESWKGNRDEMPENGKHEIGKLRDSNNEHGTSTPIAPITHIDVFELNSHVRNYNKKEIKP